MNIFAFSPGPIEIGVVLVIMLVLFGKKLPEVGRSLGKGLVEFKKGVKGVQDEVDINVDAEARLQIEKEVEKKEKKEEEKKEENTQEENKSQ